MVRSSATPRVGVEAGEKSVLVSSTHPFGVLVLSSMAPRIVARLVRRIGNEVAEARVCGILYERRPGKTLRKRTIAFLRNLRDWSFIIYVMARFLRSLSKPLATTGPALLRLAHACPAQPNGPTEYGMKELARLCENLGASLFVTQDMHSPEAIEFVRSLHPDLGIVYGTRILKPELFNVPRLGSINIHKRKLPDYRGSGPPGLWELLDGQEEIGITVHRVEKELDAGAIIHEAAIPIEPFDTLTSLATKADLVGNDLLVCCVAEFARGNVHERPQVGPFRMFKSPKPHHLHRYEKQITSRRPSYKPSRGRPAWKLLLRLIVLAPLVVLRNWLRRLHGQLPVIVLYHHIVTDRPHFLGIPTDLFLKQVEFLQKHYKIASLSEAIRLLETNMVKAPTVVLTFDDGYLDNFINLRAVCEEMGIPAALFVCARHITDQNQFAHDTGRGENGFLPFTWEQLKYLSRNGFEVGSHTRSHFDCGSTEPAALQCEIVGSKTDLENQLEQPVRFFSFPWGKTENMSTAAVELAESTYSYVFSAYGGANFSPGHDKLRHLFRCAHPDDIWELELTLQSILDF